MKQLEVIKQFLHEQRFASDRHNTEAVDIVDRFRELYLELDSGLLDELHPDSDQAADLICNEVPRVKALAVNTDDLGNWIPCWAEQDISVFSIEFSKYKELDMDDDTALEILLAIMYWFDCTGCCNAIEFIRISQYGVLVQIASGRTFHS